MAIQYALSFEKHLTAKSADLRGCNRCGPGSVVVGSQGCSTLWDSEKLKQAIDAGESGTVAVLAERAGSVGCAFRGIVNAESV